ncbi:MAG TPA: hypothetical protein VNT79_07615 [Phycisphaerae bacterium]|nr:hypothetical protein [Phycisphaerae bacterium]
MNSTTSWHKSGSASALPGALSDLIDRVIRRTRLWRSEKRDVRAELESHFREGLDELAMEGLPLDASVRVLAESFGNPDLAATLIRRGKRRGRPMIWKLAFTATMALLGLMAAGGGYVAYLTLASPNPTVDYLKQLNESAEETTEEQRAWTLLQKSLLKLTPVPQTLSLLNPLEIRPQSPEWPSVREWVELNRPLLPEFHEAAHRPHYGFIYGGPDTAVFMRRLAELQNDEAMLQKLADSPDPLVPKLISILLPHLAEMQKAAWFLVLDARDHVSSQNFFDAIASLDVCHRLGAKLFEGETLIEQLVGIKLMRMSCEELRQIVTWHGTILDNATKASIASGHVFTMPEREFVPHLDGERLSFHDAVQYLFTDDGQGNGRLIPSQFAKIRDFGTVAPAETSTLNSLNQDAEMVALAARHADRLETLEKYDELWDEMARYRELPLYDPQRRQTGVILQRFADDPETKVRFAVLDILIPNLMYADQVIREAAMENAATRSVVQIARFRADRGTWPQSWDALVPGYLTTAPIDVFTGDPLVFAIDKAGNPRVYSVGRNQKDDGGSLAPIPDSGRGDRTTPADLIYFNAPSK